MLGQSPFDPSSGAAQSMRAMATMVSDAGWDVKSVTTTATENAAEHQTQLSDHFPHLEDLGKTLTLKERGVSYQFFKVEPQLGRSWYRLIGDRYDKFLRELFSDFKPDLVLTFGGDPHDVERMEYIRQQGCKIVFALHNEAYLHPSAPASCRQALEMADALLAPSQYLARVYQKRLRRSVDVLPPPVLESDSIAEPDERAFITIVNPEPAKGLMIILRLLEYFGKHRPDIPFLIVAGRANTDTVHAAAKAFDLNLSRFENIFMTSGVMQAKDIFQHTRVLLMPSVWSEPAGRLPIEAMLNGIPSITSNRGGLPEMVGNAGYVLSIPDTLTMQSKRLPTTKQIKPWIDAILKLCDDEQHYKSVCSQAIHESRRYQESTLGIRISEYFSRVAAL